MSGTPKSVSLLASLSAEVMPFRAQLGHAANVSLIFDLAVSSTIEDNVRRWSGVRSCPVMDQSRGRLRYKAPGYVTMHASTEQVRHG